MSSTPPQQDQHEPTAPEIASEPVEMAPSQPPTTLEQTPKGWRYAPDAWRIAGRVDMRYVDMLFRPRSAAVIPPEMRMRFVEMGIPADVVHDTLRSIRRGRDWSTRWVETAQRFLGEFRRQTSASNPRDAAKARQTAALCYHAAQIFELEDERTVRQCRAAAASLFTLSLPSLYPNARHIWVPWRTTSLPAYFLPPDNVTEPVGVVVFLNGVSMSKEETIAWHPRFLRQGYAVLALDSPGTGEATGVGNADGSHDDIVDGVFELFRDEPMIDLDRVAVLGLSLGGNQAVRAAAHNRRIMAAIAITPPYEPARWIRRASPLLLQEMGLVRDAEVIPEMWGRVEGFNLVDRVREMRQPLLVFGGARDVLVPPTDAQHLAKAAGKRATLVWYPRGGHCLYEAADQWSFEAAAWIKAVEEGRGDPQIQRDITAISAHARAALEAAEYTPLPRSGESTDDDDFAEYARLIRPDDD
jgi:pimeloyl-ACP methyl ester carboxylesterase